MAAGRERDLERLLTFIDAVVAIAITLLVLPLAEAGSEIQGRTVSELLRDHVDDLFGFFLSFTVIARLWLTQHTIVSSLIRQNGAVIRLLFCWCLTIVFLPFPTTLVTATANDGSAKLLYIGTMAVSSGLLALLGIVITRDRTLRDRDDGPDTAITIAVTVDVPAGAGHLARLPGHELLAAAPPGADRPRRVAACSGPAGRLPDRVLTHRDFPGSGVACRPCDRSGRRRSASPAGRRRNDPDGALGGLLIVAAGGRRRTRGRALVGLVDRARPADGRGRGPGRAAGDRAGPGGRAQRPARGHHRVPDDHALAGHRHDAAAPGAPTTSRPAWAAGWSSTRTAPCSRPCTSSTAPTRIQVDFADGTQAAAQVTASRPEHDIAVLARRPAPGGRRARGARRSAAGRRRRLRRRQPARPAAQPHGGRGLGRRPHDHRAPRPRAAVA